jgi:hypothetical protein
VKWSFKVSALKHFNGEGVAGWHRLGGRNEGGQLALWFSFFRAREGGRRWRMTWGALGAATRLGKWVVETAFLDFKQDLSSNIKESN